ncbi:hypothetical protein ACOMHN_054941 [Nucella lapillus]
MKGTSRRKKTGQATGLGAVKRATRRKPMSTLFFLSLSLLATALLDAFLLCDLEAAVFSLHAHLVLFNFYVSIQGPVAFQQTVRTSRSLLSALEKW